MKTGLTPSRRRVLFIFGLLPALLVFWIRRHIKDAETFTRRDAADWPDLAHLFSALKPPHLATTWRLAFMVTGAQGGGYALSV